MSKKTSPKKSPAKSAPNSQVKSPAKPQAIPKGLYASATPGRANNKGGVSHGHGGNSSSEPSFSSAKAENQSNSDDSSLHQANKQTRSATSAEARAPSLSSAKAEGIKKGRPSSYEESLSHAPATEATKNDMTVARMLGEIVWIMTQSPGHKHFSLGDLEWMVMPALLLEQYRIFRNGTQPLGVALWAYLSPEAEEKLKSGTGRLRPDEWAVGMKLDPEDGVTHGAGGALWLVDLICPFHTPENKMADQMLADLIQGPFKGKKFKFHHTDPGNGERKIMELGG